MKQGNKTSYTQMEQTKLSIICKNRKTVRHEGNEYTTKNYPGRVGWKN